VGTGNHVLQLSNVNTTGARTLTINFNASQTSSRRIAVWTDASSGGAPDITYLTADRRTNSDAANVGTATGWIRLNPRIDSTNPRTSVTIPIPASIMNGATRIYVAITTDTADVANTDAQRGATEFNRITTITLT
jgi:hypothetical protein